MDQAALTDAVVKRLSHPPRATRHLRRRGDGLRRSRHRRRRAVLRPQLRHQGRARAPLHHRPVPGLADHGRARAKARELRRLIDEGGDPLADIEAERAAPTVDELCDRFEQEHLPRKRPGTAERLQAAC